MARTIAIMLHNCKIFVVQQYCQSTIGDESHNGLEFASRGCLVQLKNGDTIQFYQDNYMQEENYNYNDVSYQETAFRGFLYSPSHQISIAWSVHIDGSVSVAGDRLVFSELLVNVGNCWRADNNQVKLIDTNTSSSSLNPETFYYKFDPSHMHISITCFTFGNKHII